jgi:hypothetical protein
MLPQEEELLLEPLLAERVRRRKLLPLWIKIFIHLFMLMGAVTMLGLVAGLAGMRFHISIYGFESNDPLSLLGLLAAGLLLFKGIVGYGLWTEKDWGVQAGIIDAIIGIALCVFAMVVMPFIDGVDSFSLNLRLELVLLIPYLLRLMAIKPRWSRVQ